jgi:hypothetical protein
VLAECREWAIEALPLSDSSITGRSAPAAELRYAASASWRPALAAVPAGMARRNASKTRCSTCVILMTDLNHYLIFSGGSWTIEHSNECRMSEDLMAACPYNEAVALIADGYRDPGR